MVLEFGVGDFDQRGLRLKGNSEPRLLDHQSIVGTVADREHVPDR